LTTGGIVGVVVVGAVVVVVVGAEVVVVGIVVVVVEVEEVPPPPPPLPPPSPSPPPDGNPPEEPSVVEVVIEIVVEVVEEVVEVVDGNVVEEVRVSSDTMVVDVGLASGGGVSRALNRNTARTIKPTATPAPTSRLLRVTSAYPSAPPRMTCTRSHHAARDIPVERERARPCPAPAGAKWRWSIPGFEWWAMRKEGQG